MNNPYHDLETTVRNYVLNKLSDQETEDFEAYYLSNPDIIEMVETVQNIQLGMQHAQQPLRTESVKLDKSSDMSWLRALGAWITIPVPAYLAIGVAVLAAPLAYNGLKPSNSADQLALVNFSTSVTRSVGTPVALDLSTVDGTPAVFVKVKRVQYQHYVLKVSTINSEKIIWASKPFEVSALRDKLVVLPASAKKDNVTIKVFGIEQDGIETSVEFCHYSEVCN